MVDNAKVNNIYCIAADERVCDVARKELADSAVKAWKGIYKNVRTAPLEDVIDTSEPVIHQAQQLFDKMNCPYEVWEQDGNIYIDIHWGDWKHDHANANHVMETAFGYVIVNEIVTEEDGSDAYSATHMYRPA